MATVDRRHFLQALGAMTTGAAYSNAFADVLPHRPPLKLIDVRCIWDRSPHNGFTDLVRFGDQFFCGFREAEAHRARVGTIRILASPDGQKWESAATLTSPGLDLRDPKLTVTPGGRLMLNGAMAVTNQETNQREIHSFVSFSEDGRTWDPIRRIVEPNEWLFRSTWHKGKAYGVAYSCTAPMSKTYTALYVSDNGIDYRPLVSRLLEGKGATEATLRFGKDDTCYCLQRRDFQPPNRAWLGTSRPPYTEWTWKETAMYFGGPNFLQLPDGRWVAVGRFRSDPDGRKNDEGASTLLCELNVERAYLIPCLTLPSRFDTSYAGMVWHDGKLWISYYSSKEVKQRTHVYLAVLELGATSLP